MSRQTWCGILAALLIVTVIPCITFYETYHGREKDHSPALPPGIRLNIVKVGGREYVIAQDNQSNNLAICPAEGFVK